MSRLPSTRIDPWDLSCRPPRAVDLIRSRNLLGLRASSERHGAEPYCRTWNVWDNGRTRCYTVYRDGEAFELHLEDRLSKFKKLPAVPL